MVLNTEVSYRAGDFLRNLETSQEVPSCAEFFSPQQTHTASK